MVRSTTLTFYRPTREDGDLRSGHNGPPEVVLEARGYLEHRAMTRVQTDLGVGAENNWLWIGRLPNGVHPRATWTAQGMAEGRQRKFRVQGAAPGNGAWQVDLQEVVA